MTTKKSKKLFAVLLCVMMAFALVAFNGGNALTAKAATAGDPIVIDFRTNKGSDPVGKTVNETTEFVIDATGYQDATTYSGTSNVMTMVIPKNGLVMSYAKMSGAGVITWATTANSTCGSNDLVFRFNLSNASQVKFLLASSSSLKASTVNESFGKPSTGVTGSAKASKNLTLNFADSNDFSDCNNGIYVEANLPKGESSFAIIAGKAVGNVKLGIVAVECTPILTATYSVGDGKYVNNEQLVEQTAQKSADDGKYYVKTPVSDAVAQVDSGYAFVGWSIKGENGSSIYNSNSDVEITDSVEIKAVYAKIQYLGISFRKSNPGIRFGFTAVCMTNTSDKTTEFYPSTDEFTNGQYDVYLDSVKALSNVSATKFAQVTDFGGSDGINFNLVIISFKLENATKTLKVDARCNINGVALEASSGDVIAKDKATGAVGLGQLTAEEASLYGYVIPVEE